MHSLIKHSEDFKLHLDDDTANFTELKPGMLLCEQPQEEYRVGQEGRGYCSLTPVWRWACVPVCC